MAENLNSQLKQMSEDLKEVIEHLNEANKNQELSNPVRIICEPLILFTLIILIVLDNTNWKNFECSHEFFAMD